MTRPDRLRLRLAGITTPMMRGDNLSIVLASAFENPDQEIDGDEGWTQDAINGALEVLDAIHDHYARAILAERERTLRAANEYLKQQYGIHLLENPIDRARIDALLT